MKNSFLSRTLKGAKIYIALILILSAIYSKLLIYIPMFIRYAIDGVILEDNNIIYDKLVVGCEDKYTYCLENDIEIMIDDEPQNIDNISKIIPVIAFNEKYNEDYIGKNIIKVDTWEETYKTIKNIEKDKIKV